MGCQASGQARTPAAHESKLWATDQAHLPTASGGALDKHRNSGSKDPATPASLRSKLYTMCPVYTQHCSHRKRWGTGATYLVVILIGTEWVGRSLQLLPYSLRWGTRPRGRRGSATADRPRKQAVGHPSSTEIPDLKTHNPCISAV